MKPRNMVVFLFCCVILSGCLKPNEDFSKNLCDEDARCSDGFTCICNMENHTKICVDDSKLSDDAVYASKETICMIESDGGVDVGTDVEADGNVPDAEADVQTDISSDAEQDGGLDLSPDNGTDLAPDSGEDITCIPSTEICDLKDNDCDGDTDEDFNNLNQACSSGLGECEASGVYVCSVDGKNTTCNAVAGIAVAEECDELDNDCDGVTDEELVGCCDEDDVQECGSNVGECQKGQMTCQADGSWGQCENSVDPADDLCDNKDNDCDGNTDEDFINLNSACQIGQGVCLSHGVFACSEDGLVTECNAEIIQPSEEVCDQQDNNCDGFTDEDFDLTIDTNNCGSCNHVCGNQGTASSICEAGECVLQCSRFRFDVNSDPTDGCECEVTNCGVEICDQVDNDCDGAVDEDCQSLVMYLSFDNHFNDGSTNANNAVNHGATFTADAVCGQAASFDGVDDYAEVADSVSMDSIANEFTILISIKLRALVLRETIFTKTSQSPGLATDNIDNNFRWVFYTSMVQKIVTTKTVETNKWINFAARYVNGQLTIFADGEQIGQSFVQLQPGGIVYLASPNGIAGSHKTNAIFDGFSIYNKGFSDEEIAHFFEIMK